MAFDQPTRNRLQKFVSEARSLLTIEFTRQFQNDYGLDPESGNISPIEVLTGLDDERLSTATILRETFNHYQSTTPGENTKDLLERIVREQAFTMLNRFSAIRMAEARGILFESISKGYQSKGFQLYSRVASSGLGSTFDAYRNYIFSVFDELALDLTVLFDRFSPFGRLFPRQAAIEELLGLLNHPEIDHLWGEDETIGWIYQYFNSKDERRKMRDESPAPRNSRELAVRNQFFTPRYVVEFLTDNTLGKIWYEMTKSETPLAASCRYLVRRPNEVFLELGQNAAEVEADQGENLSQEELLKQTVYIPHRPLKDPREILMLDPACGSMHFGLYAFDLFLKIYEEAWDLSVGPSSSGGLIPLRETYANDKESFLLDVPRLIIEYNIHGVDIDPRAVQIAGLSLWLRAQRAWAEQGVKAVDRPRVRRSNIVCAEPMPGETDLLEEFMAKHFADTAEKRLLGEFVRRVFDSMKLAGEAGSLLKIEEEVANLISESRERWCKLQEKGNEKPVLFDYAPVDPQLSLDFKVGEITDANFWDRAENEIYKALRAYSESGENGGGFQRRLFADDAAQGFAFIDLCRKRYDVVVMNPPFGAFSKASKAYAAEQFPDSANDIFAAFVEGGLSRLTEAGDLGAITSRTGFFIASFADWRRQIVQKMARLNCFADLGGGVMDNATVEAAAYVLSRNTEASRRLGGSPFIRLFLHSDKAPILADAVGRINEGEHLPSRLFWADNRQFGMLPDGPFVYWADPITLSSLASLPSFEPAAAQVRKGLRTGDNFRYVRALWEIPTHDFTPSISADDSPSEREISKWVPLVLSGSSQPWFSPLLVAINWKANGKELRQYVTKYGSPSRLIQAEDFYFKPGMSWTLRAARFVPYAIPSGCIPTGSRPMAFPLEGIEYRALAVSASRVASAFMRFYGDWFTRPKFLEGKVKLFPWPDIPPSLSTRLDEWVQHEANRRRTSYRGHEPFFDFIKPFSPNDHADGAAISIEWTSLLGSDLESSVEKAFGLEPSAAAELCHELDEALSVRSASPESDDAEQDEDEGAELLLDYSERGRIDAVLSHAIGCAFGRWDIRYATGERPAPELPDPFAPLPVCPPGMLQNAVGLPATPEDVPTDYPLEIVWSGILVDDAGNTNDVQNRLREGLQVIWKDRADSIETEACEILGVRSMREYFRRPAGFFADHLKRYSKSRRQAPIYLPLSTSSGSYTLWLYYHRLTDQTLYTCVNDFVDPKLRQVKDEIASLGSKQGRSHDDEKQLEHLTELAFELEEFRDELLRLAPAWKPNLNDGVQITLSPMWKLFRLPKWRKTLEDTWKKLEKGDYDWAHLAYSFFPERVREKCRRDKSLAIAHDLEDLYEEPPAKTRKARTKQAPTAPLPLADG